MPDGMVIGALLAAAAVAIGVIVGYWLARRSPVVTEAEVKPVLANLLQFTNEFSRDVSEYRSLIQAASKQANAWSNAPQEGASGADQSALLLKQILEANEHLQRRLVEAESSLNSQSEQLNAYMTEARTDALTGLTNRRAFDEELQRRFSMFARQAVPVGVMLIDVDRFKSVNDTYGHAVGDAVLIAIAAALRSAVRESDLLARYGGEEFAVLIAGSSAEQFCKTAERLRKSVEGQEVRAAEHVLTPTVSCGVSQLMSGDEPSSVLHRADEGLYAAKEGGRNCTYWNDGIAVTRVTLAPAPPEPALNHSEKFRHLCAELRRKLQEIAQ